MDEEKGLLLETTVGRMRDVHTTDPTLRCLSDMLHDANREDELHSKVFGREHVRPGRETVAASQHQVQMSARSGDKASLVWMVLGADEGTSHTGNPVRPHLCRSNTTTNNATTYDATTNHYNNQKTRNDNNQKA